MKQVIWSNFENSPFIENEVLKEGLKSSNFTKEEMISFIRKHEKENYKNLESVVKEQFNKEFNDDILSIVLERDNCIRVGQHVTVLGKNLNSIFNIPFDYVTWYIDSWNIRADVCYKGLTRDYVFREVRPNKNIDFFITSINENKKLLTPTYMGGYTMTLYLRRRKRSYF